MYLLYTVAALLLVVAAVPVFIFRIIREKNFAERIWQSLGNVPADIIQRLEGRSPVWIHAASVGEMVATSAIVKEIKAIMPEIPIVVSSVTQNGYEMAQRIITEAEAVIYFPLDLPWIVQSVLRHIHPQAFLMVETELWPNFLRAAKRQHVSTMVVSGRISDRSFHQYRYFFNMVKSMLGNVNYFCMQSKLDADYIVSLGADPAHVFVTGNSKFDQTYTELSEAERANLKNMLGIQQAVPVIIAGSTHPGEEELILEAFQLVRQSFPSAVLIIAPRKIARMQELLELSRKYSFSAAARSSMQRECEQHPVIILDTIGELGKLYSIADLVFIGGSLVPHGGHNILEPAAHGKPIVVGPHMFNFKESLALLKTRNACIQVEEGVLLPQIMLEILTNQEKMNSMGQQALAVINENKGAAQRSAKKLQQLLANRAE